MQLELLGLDAASIACTSSFVDWLHQLPSALTITPAHLPTCVI